MGGKSITISNKALRTNGLLNSNKETKVFDLLAGVFLILLVIIVVIIIISFKSFDDTLLTGQIQRTTDHARIVAKTFKISTDDYKRIKEMSIEESRLQPQTIDFKKMVNEIVQLDGIAYVYIVSKLNPDEVKYSFETDEEAAKAGYSVGTRKNYEYVFTSEDESDYLDTDRYDCLDKDFGSNYSDAKLIWTKYDEIQWNTALSGYYPFYTTNGDFIGYVGVDVGLADYRAEQGRLNITLWTLLCIIFILFLVLFIVLVQRLRTSLNKDVLTGLINRNAYRAIISRRLENSTQGMSAFYFLDLDSFKFINDTYGHSEGDKVLVSIARKLNQLTEKGTLLIRIAGDEFGIFKQGFISIDQAEAYGRKIVEGISNERLNIGNDEIRVTASIGCSIWEIHAKTVTELIEYADFAMYRAKSYGKACFRMFDMDEWSTNQHQFNNNDKVKEIMLTGKYEHYFEPIVDAKTGVVAGYEGFTRLLDKKFILESDFKTVGRGIEIERFNTLSLVKTFKNFGQKNVFLCINESIEDMYADLDYKEQKEYLSAFKDLDIVIEVNEVRWIDIIKVMEKAKSIREAGHRVALDDFVSGSRCSTLMVGMNPEFIKLSPDLVCSITSSANVQKFIRLTVQYAHKLNCKVIAVGVETEESMGCLVNTGVDYLQGPFIGLPTINI